MIGFLKKLRLNKTILSLSALNIILAILNLTYTKPQLRRIAEENQLSPEVGYWHFVTQYGSAYIPLLHVAPVLIAISLIVLFCVKNHTIFPKKKLCIIGCILFPDIVAFICIIAYALKFRDEFYRKGQTP